MIARLRRKFVLVAMLSVALVLTGIMAAVNAANYLGVQESADARLRLLAEGDGTFPAGFGEDMRGREAGGTQAPPPDGLSPETPFETRFFTVTLTADGAVEAVDTDRIAAVSRSDAESWAQELARAGRTAGFHGSYRFLAVAGAADDGSTMYIFLDCSRDLASFWSFLTTSAGMSALGLALVFAISLGLSRVAVRPIEVAYERQKRFITDASHEIKTPLSVIDAANEVIEIEHGEDEWTRSIHGQVARLSSLTERLVMLARMDETGGRLPMETVGLSELVLRGAAAAEPVIEARGHRLAVDVEPGISCRGNAAALEQALELLLDNAGRYASAGSEVRLSLRAAGRGAELAVENDCDELPAGDLDRLFERFYRPDRSRSSATGGTGVGLSVVRAVAEAHRGTAAAERRGEHRIAFLVRLP